MKTAVAITTGKLAKADGLAFIGAQPFFEMSDSLWHNLFPEGADLEFEPSVHATVGILKCCIYGMFLRWPRWRSFGERRAYIRNVGIPE
jgi:hypothetical protein